ncbi:MAG: hypothetical protein KDA81_01965 [Planctomycetaceae bacterium]|nr:hypothetical protein [Planctomycetaceae bacterium]
MKSSAVPEYSDIQINPSLKNWASLLTTVELDHAQLQQLRTSARQRLVESAVDFVRRLNALADDADLNTGTQPMLSGNPSEQPLVMTGHQPVVFHSGLTFKYETTEAFASQNNAIGIAVVIDTDQGDAGQFSYPAIPDNTEPGELSDAFPAAELQIDSIAESLGLYGHGRLKSAPEIAQISDTLCQRLEELSMTTAVTNVREALLQFGQLSAVRASVMQANLITRWQHGIGSRLLEIPLSSLASFPEMLTLTSDILKQPRRFASAYNAALEMYRDENNIRNAANPFPNLKVTDDTCELPFWVISHNRKTRHALEVQLDGNVTRLLANGRVVDTFAGNITPDALEPMLLQNIQIVPRGALITAFLRLLFSDLFVHGTGGGRYDRFTDEFVRTWWNIEPPPFAVASASRYLFPELRSELARLEHIQSQLRDLQYNPQRYLNDSIFTADLQQRLNVLCQEKQDLVDQMKRRHSAGESAQDIGRQIQTLTNQIRDDVSAEFERPLQKLNRLTPEQRDAINCRTYPWFMFR